MVHAGKCEMLVPNLRKCFGLENPKGLSDDNTLEWIDHPSLSMNKSLNNKLDFAMAKKPTRKPHPKPVRTTTLSPEMTTEPGDTDEDGEPIPACVFKIKCASGGFIDCLIVGLNKVEGRVNAPLKESSSLIAEINANQNSN